jgi:hypothetical protein
MSNEVDSDGAKEDMRVIPSTPAARSNCALFEVSWTSFEAMLGKQDSEVSFVGSNRLENDGTHAVSGSSRSQSVEGQKVS